MIFEGQYDKKCSICSVRVLEVPHRDGVTTVGLLVKAFISQKTISSGEKTQ